MPLYLYENKETEEVVEVLQGMNEVHEYQGECGTQKDLWRRVYVNPGLSSDTKMDAFDSKSFVKSTVNKNDTYGDLQNRAAEASAIRAQKNGGRDPVKEKYYDNYKNKTNGKLHPNQQKEKFKTAVEKAKKIGINVEL
jgi:hypothetical protein